TVRQTAWDPKQGGCHAISVNRLLLILCVVATTAGSIARSADAKYFRSDNGGAGSAAGPLPGDFVAPGALRWRVPVDSGHSTPILCDGKIFLTTYRAASKELATVALDENTGETLWRCPISAA